MLSSQRQNKHRNAHTGTENDVRNDGDEPDGECQDERFGRRELPDSDDSNDDDRKTSTSSTQRVAGSKRRIEDIDVANDEGEASISWEIKAVRTETKLHPTHQRAIAYV